ncbi:bifunctional phosphopantothenoylcysteine decarboxylase/phosphopantothenate--cysteine ligase CoaBC [Salegentibacter sp. BLCTC]|uniref:Coenzyme A biosynthesis bifunctional protein CoaBC n=1 Tax=Salegentibacter maritimus TaxID=2794347 RepID=A0ABS0TGT9_9FLAO|nr:MULTISPECIES: bifunctional phosphopantothenoylcysteine decarboxylase/phosphopantothenate--cysteine ligase CoaBC [Salegentibacter]MBE7641204.1 bifunctional phosphopantothenoylcysteine decarboxylase/phosphopantothenate--cysteine ligase CoaBC [Salegentibacter sp. BLCTC]MBI6120248.1 bifunctional phosphopantothenoylcysteine decarboxylase/phosphopantothenate--cysteine ligase CoaBC [Salegentibacter maritimus]
MSVLKGKKVLLGISGGIAAYKSAFLVRLFIKAGAQVKVIMTPAAKEFVTPLTLSTLSKNEVFSSFTEDDEDEQWNNHVELGLWADFMLLAPATANTLSKMASGNSDNFLLATYLSAKCPVFFAPAMDLDMFKHPSTTNSFETLKSYGNIMIPAGTGELASGLTGEGRMAEPEVIIDFLENYFSENLPLKGKKLLITAGPTYEAIDPVRFIGNHSSGKMGFELAKKAADFGAEVILISGPTHLEINDSRINLIRVVSTGEMYTAVHNYFEDVDVAIAAAAVSDYTPKNVATQKIKKADENLSLELTKTPDILLSMGKKKTHQKLIGFALETNNELVHAREKLLKKNLDFIVLNSMNDAGAGFKKDTNKVTLVYKDSEKAFDLKSKAEVATDIINEIVHLLDA